MADTQLLDKYYRESCKKKTALAEKINVSRPRLNYIFSHPESATVGQATDLSKELGIPAADTKKIFLP